MYLSICAICKNEERYIGDWINYHHKIGVDHFFLYENDSTDKTWDAIKAFPKEVVTAYKLSGVRQQVVAYNNCVLQHRSGKVKARWLAFIDIDEYIVPHTTNNLQLFLKDYESFTALCAHWILFGSNGHKEYQPHSVVERFTKCQQGVNDHVKSIVNPKLTGMYHTPHRFHTIGKTVDENKKELASLDPYPKGGTANKIQINHYSVKSYEECMYRKSYPRADTGQQWDAKTFFEAHDRNERENFRALELWKK